MKKYYRIERVESTTSAAILKIVSNLQKDVEELKRKIAWLTARIKAMREDVHI